MAKHEISFSVLMPTFNQCAFIRRAILSLMRQTYANWELIIINDGCTDETEEYISDYLDDPRVTYIKNDENMGLGHALNQGLDTARCEYIAYLPSDDYFFPNHLDDLQYKFSENEAYNLVYSGLRYGDCDSLHGAPQIASGTVREGFGMQLVQVAHRRSKERWVERREWISDDLFAMFWRKLAREGVFAPTRNITCYWTQHPDERHNLINEKFRGGINKVRNFYHIKYPIRIKVSREKFINEDRLWFNQFLPPGNAPYMIMDGDLPKRDYFKDTFSEKLSAQDGEIHTVCAGRLIGLGESGLALLAKNHIHLHLYIENFHASRARLFHHYEEMFQDE